MTRYAKFFVSKVRDYLALKGIEVVGLRTHRGISLCSDVSRLLGPKQNVTIFDVGANRGDFSRSLLKYFPNGMIFAFEPVKSTFDVLQKSTKKIPQIRPIYCALGERDGLADMTAVPLSGCNRVLSAAESASHETVVVEMRTLAGFADETGITNIDLLKTDCEGYDLNVLRGGESLLRDRRVSMVYSEVNMRRDEKHGDFFAIDGFLRNYGYLFYALYDYSGAGSSQAETFCNALWVNDRFPA